MPEIHVRPAIEEDIPKLVALEHNYTSDYVWQLEAAQKREEGQVETKFKQVRLPRSIWVEYPRSPDTMVADWMERSGLLVALLDGKTIGYVSLSLGLAPGAAWITDLVVARPLRRKGIGSTLLLAAMEWGVHNNFPNLILEMQPKNYPAVQLAFKLGFDFCGYNDSYYENNEIGIFFAKALI